MKRPYIQRSAEDLREAAARVCERMARADEASKYVDLAGKYSLREAASRIRRLPIAGCIGNIKSR